MSEQIKENDKQIIEPQEAQNAENNTTQKKAKPKFKKKKLIIIAAAVAIGIVFLIPSKFERVQSKCVEIVGMVIGSGDYFTIDTCPEGNYGFNIDVTNALKAIKYANEELGFNGSVYSKMMETTALMGRQSEENDKYKVSWTYHPDDGLEVTYEKK